MIYVERKKFKKSKTRPKPPIKFVPFTIEIDEKLVKHFVKEYKTNIEWEKERERQTMTHLSFLKGDYNIK